MGDYLPKHLPGDSITRTASAAIIGGLVAKKVYDSRKERQLGRAV